MMTAKEYRSMISTAEAQLYLAKRAGNRQAALALESRLAVYRANLKIVEGESKMSTQSEELVTPFWLRLLGALGVTAVIGYFVYLPFDIANGWGQGWIILGWAGLFILAVIALLILSAVWYWTYEGLPRVRFARRQQKD